MYFENPESASSCCALNMLSASGLGFEVPEQPDSGFTPGALLQAVTLTVGGLEIAGEIAVRNSQPASGGKVAIGGVFLPASTDAERTLVSILTGMDALLVPDPQPE